MASPLAARCAAYSRALAGPPQSPDRAKPQQAHSKPNSRQWPSATVLVPAPRTGSRSGQQLWSASPTRGSGRARLCSCLRRARAAGRVPVLSRYSPGIVPVESPWYPGIVPVLSRYCPGSFPVLSRYCPGQGSSHGGLSGYSHPPSCQ